MSKTAARVVTSTRKRKHITPVLKELHCLPVRKRLDHKIMSLAYKCFGGTEPEDLQELIPRYIPARPFRSSSHPRLRIPSATEKHTNKQLGFRAFSDSAPNLWNALPQAIREADSSTTFRRRLKTRLFSDCLFCFSVCWTHCAPKLFSVFPRLFFSCPFSICNLLQRSEHSSQWNHAL